MFVVQKTSRFERDITKLAKKSREVVVLYEQALLILHSDPYNLSRQHKINKLTDVSAGEGEWRLRIGVYRIRYDVCGRTVELHSIKLRKDAYR